MTDPTASAYARTGSENHYSYWSHPVKQVVVTGYSFEQPNSYATMSPTWTTLRDCYGGEGRVKSRGKIYLQKFSAHSEDDYTSYLRRAYFYNAVRRTHTGLMGSLFRKPPEFTIPSAVKFDQTNITLDAESLRAFSKKIGFELLLVGRYGVLADFKDSNADEAYLTGYDAENVYGWRQIVHKGRKITDRVVLIENEVTLTEYGSESVEIYRILRLDPDPEFPGELRYSQEIVRPNAANIAGTPISTKIPYAAKGGRPLRYIPFVFFNPMDLLPDAKLPILYDIATMNLTHYTSTAQLEHGRFYAGMPTYVTSGDLSEHIPGIGSPNAPRTVGPSSIWELEKDAKAWLLEFTGHGLTFLENAVDSKQLQMQSLGGRLISSTRRAAALSDEAWQLLETGDEATLLDVAEVLDEGLAQALSYLAHIRGDISDPEKSGIVAEFNKEFVRSELTARELRALQSLYERGIIPLDVMYYALREVSVIPVEYSLEDFTALMKKKDQIYEAPPLPAPAGPGPGVRPPKKTLSLPKNGG